MNITLLLTTTINPPPMVYLERSDVALREKDTCDALEKWIATGHKIVLCENSGYISDNLQKIIKKAEGKIEFLSFQGKESPKGKGHGEAEILQYAYAHSEILHQSEWICKVTGRYFVKNFDEIIQNFPPHNSLYVVGDLSRRLTWADTRCLFFRPVFFEQFWVQHFSKIDEANGIYMEHITAHSILESIITKPNTWAMPPVYPLYEGVLATYNQPYQTGWYRQLKNYILLKIKTFAYDHHS